MKIRGTVDHCDNALIEGWIYDADAPQTRIQLEVFAAGIPIGTCTADVLREDLKAAGLGDGEIAFSFHMPDPLPPNAMNDIVLRVFGTDVCLPTRPPNQARPMDNQPATVSRFGGLWIDRLDWIDVLGMKHRTGELDDDAVLQIFRFVRDGYLVIPAAVPMRLIAALNDEIDRLWTRPPETLMIETFEPDDIIKYISPEVRYRTGRTKLLDVYSVSDIARRVTAARAAMRFLAAIFEDTPKVFQQLALWRSPEQPMHKDAAYVKVQSNPLALAATWLALEDVVPGTGEVEYFVGSHRAPEFLFGNVSKWYESFPADHDRFLAKIQEDAETLRHRRANFLARAGDLVIWHADLAHGDAKATRPNTTRRSLVTHFTPNKELPFYRSFSQNQEMTTETCNFVSQFADVK